MTLQEMYDMLFEASDYVESIGAIARSWGDKTYELLAEESANRMFKVREALVEMITEKKKGRRSDG